MQQASDVAQWELMRAQIVQSMLEHEIVTQALRVQSIVSALFILALGSLCFFLWRRHGSLNEAFHAEIGRHSVERCGLVKRHSNELCELVARHSSERVSMLKEQSLQLASMQMQMLHSFEGMASRGRVSSASSPSTAVTAIKPPPPAPPKSGT